MLAVEEPVTALWMGSPLRHRTKERRALKITWFYPLAQHCHSHIVIHSVQSCIDATLKIPCNGNFIIRLC